MICFSVCWVLVQRFASIFTKLMAYDDSKFTDDAVIISNIEADADSENYLHLDEINRINLLSTPASRAKTTSPIHEPKLFEVKLRLMRQTDLKNRTPSVARRPRLVYL